MLDAMGNVVVPEISGKISATTPMYRLGQYAPEAGAAILTAQLQGPIKCSAENPYLYTLVFTLMDEKWILKVPELVSGKSGTAEWKTDDCPGC